MSDFASYPSLKGRSVFISGGGSGIGAELVTQFCAQGARVAFIDVAEEASQALVETIGRAGHPAPVFINCDVTDIDALRAAIVQAEAAHGGIDVLVNNAANDQRHKLAELTPDDWTRITDVNVRHQLFAIQAVSEGMRRRRHGSIINFSSVTWLKGTPGLPVYVASKAAVVGLTRAMARELGPDGIRVNVILPGWIMTERQVRLWLTPEGEARLMQNQCIPEKLYPPDVARMALFLAADDSRLITGQSLVVDGGAT
ncbi:SDR family oxidoreductase [Bradyrhizobium sp. U87765 SZCCT0131]|uniref:SDR family NAD(P)-dependent oxidoreductase n=1 Tax=unclassified Bradyrhizobium TaxID=2631580 RepID=UPI001BA54143|nr:MULTISPECIES: SDR family oxidoreductase [unclassified Bradyrhizobium]MBR1221392.1 SDR family oxidoreductase [Bradyrhizobium sp. U87765 SZCCT0131]MBR1264685.1 SDR family oxidoreductase [Bradyrhizobium sp. U87765 SZCCT0134]MBR1304409.1 SDR family oxidoreductase [Bradyrhizobium sp. U87765 SZCCT0110]MBR1322734.1 SDR family oxidoreductase [Bradyrhizobium sp. U87765 SZCCT0109]MBR1346338.1 SDR family oxidoreductase [Bradyrhizobium sp. U87765 SZCCT0048]